MITGAGTSAQIAKRFNVARPFGGELPKTAAGKIRRYNLRERAAGSEA